MKKNFMYYLIAWLIAIVTFHIVIIVLPGQKTGAFWLGYFVILLTFAGQLACAWYYMRENDVRKRFLNVQIVVISYTTLILNVIIGILCIVVTDIPIWIGVIACTLLFAFSAISVIAVMAGAGKVSALDDKIEVQTGFIKGLREQTDLLLAQVKSEEMRNLAKKVADAVRYSDPVSVKAVEKIEEEITVKFILFSSAVTANNGKDAKDIQETLLLLLKQRNESCKRMK